MIAARICGREAIRIRLFDGPVLQIMMVEAPLEILHRKLLVALRRSTGSEAAVLRRSYVCMLSNRMSSFFAFFFNLGNSNRGG